MLIILLIKTNFGADKLFFMEIKNKLLCFEYLLYQLISWYNECRPQDMNHLSFTRLKVLKLLFFVSAIRANDDDLLDIFGNFWAMQHGPVESDIYDAMVMDAFDYYSFKTRTVSCKKVFELEVVEKEIGQLKIKIDAAITQLKYVNKTIVLSPAFDLVELSHKWSAWRLAMSVANLNGKGSSRMSIDDIRTYPQFYVI